MYLELVAECFTLLYPHLLGSVLLLAFRYVGPQLLKLLHLAVQLRIFISATVNALDVQKCHRITCDHESANEGVN